MSATPRAIPFQRIAIVGTGLIGGSFGLALRDKIPSIQITGFDRRNVVEHALAAGAITDGATDLTSAVGEADLVFIALPIGATIDALPAIAALRRGQTRW